MKNKMDRGSMGYITIEGFGKIMKKYRQLKGLRTKSLKKNSLYVARMRGTLLADKGLSGEQYRMDWYDFKDNAIEYLAVDQRRCECGKWCERRRYKIKDSCELYGQHRFEGDRRHEIDVKLLIDLFNREVQK